MTQSDLQHEGLKQKIFWILTIGTLCLLQFHGLEIFSGLTQITGDRGDNRLVVYLFEHLWQVIRGKAQFLSPGIFFPEKGVLGYSEALVGYVPFYAVFRALDLPPYRAAILNFITWDAVTYFTTTILILRLFHTRAFPAAIGGALYAFSSAKLNQMNHLQLQPLAFPPLILLALYSVYQGRDGLSKTAIFLRLSAAALLLDLQIVSSFYFGWFLSFWLFLFLIVWGWQKGFKPTFKNLWEWIYKNRHPVLGATTVFALGLIPFLRIYLPVILEMGPRSYKEAFWMVPEFFSALWAGPDNWVWGWLDQMTPHFRSLPYEWEHRVALGLVLTVFWILLTRVAFRFARGKPVANHWSLFLSQKEPGFIIAIILTVSLFIIFGFKYAPKVSPWVAVFHLFPGANAIRAVSRYAIFLMLPIAAIFASWVDFQTTQSSKKYWVWALAFFALIEQQGRFPGFSAERDWEQIQELAAQLPQNCSSFFVSANPGMGAPGFELQIDAMLVSAATGIPTLNGYSGQTPRGWGLDPLSPHASTNARNWLRSKGVDTPPCELEVIYRQK